MVLRSDLGPDRRHVVRGAEKVAANAAMFATPERVERPVLVNGQAGAVIEVDGRLFSIMSFTVSDGRIVEIEALADAERLAGLGL